MVRLVFEGVSASVVVSELICYPNEHPEWNLKDQVQENIARLDEFETESDLTNDNLAAHIDVFEETIESQIAVQRFSNDTLDTLMAQQRDQKSALEKLKNEVASDEAILKIWGCTGYKILDEKERNYQFQTSGSYRCDGSSNHHKWAGNNWYRFIEPAGTQLPESPVDSFHCGTHVAGWLQGSHPMTPGKTVDRKACFKFTSSNSCNWSVGIKIRHCGNYFLYHLKNTPTCNLGYCAK